MENNLKLLVYKLASFLIDLIRVLQFLCLLMAVVLAIKFHSEILSSLICDTVFCEEPNARAAIQGNVCVTNPLLTGVLATDPTQNDYGLFPSKNDPSALIPSKKGHFEISLGSSKPPSSDPYLTNNFPSPYPSNPDPSNPIPSNFPSDRLNFPELSSYRLACLKNQHAALVETMPTSLMEVARENSYACGRLEGYRYYALGGFNDLFSCVKDYRELEIELASIETNAYKRGLCDVVRIYHMYQDFNFSNGWLMGPNLGKVFVDNGMVLNTPYHIDSVEIGLIELGFERDFSDFYS